MLAFKMQSMREHWRQLPEFWRHAIVNFFIGIVIAIALHAAHSTSWIGRFENLAMDGMMSIKSNTPGMAGGAQTPLQLTFIDIDENTYQDWQEPFYTPRHKIEQLLSFAARGKARAIVLDIDLSKASEDDSALVKFLQQYSENDPPLILLRSRYPASEHTQHQDYHFRPSFLDGKLGKNIYWGQSLFKVSNYDQELRYWELYETGCLNGKPVVVPSFQLLIDAHLTAPGELKKVIGQLQQKLPRTCESLKLSDQMLHGELPYGNKTIKLEYGANQRIGERIIYTIPWKQTGWDEFYHRPARTITETSDPVSNDAVRDRIVVIGSSHKAGRDTYKTPIGEMPGAMIIINAIKSLHAFGQIEPPSALYKWGIEIALIIVMSLAFASFHSMLAALITGALVIVVLIPVSYAFFEYGVWVDFAIPLFGIQLHRVFEQYKERAVSLHRHISRTQSNKEQS